MLFLHIYSRRVQWQRHRRPRRPTSARTPPWITGGVFRTIIAFDQKSRELVDEHFDTVPLDEAAKLYLVADRSTPIKYLRFAARRPGAIGGCISMRRVLALLPYLSYAHTLGKLGLLRARVELRDGHSQAAVEDWIAVLALGRHCGCDNLGVSMMVDYGIEDFTIQQAATQLLRLDKPALDQLLQSLDALPPGGDLTQSVREYQRAGQMARPQNRRVKDNQWEQDLAWTLNETPEKIHAAAQACGGTPLKPSSKNFLALDPLYDEQANAMSLPYDQFQQSYPPMLARMKASPAYPLLPADFSRVYQQNAYARAPA